MDAALETALRRETPVLWVNPTRRPLAVTDEAFLPPLADIRAAADRFARFAPLLAELFPELAPSGGVIESELLPVPAFAARLRRHGLPLAGTLLLKADHALPVAGSVKARGGFHAVLAEAEAIALAEGLLKDVGDDHRRLGDVTARQVFSRYTLSVGSTGNLGLSIGTLGRALGVVVTVHMSVEAKAWKKERLRAVGATVVEHGADYTTACAAARQEAANDPRIRFIDDENSLALFLGYAAAALALPMQIKDLGLAVGPDRPLFLYLPCGVGGAPGGIALGARYVFGEAAHPFIAEPTAAPCMLLGLTSSRHADVTVHDLGLSGQTVADGLAVARPSRFVGRIMEPVLSGAYTVADAAMLTLAAALHADEGLRLEPSAAAGAAGPGMLLGTDAGRDWLAQTGLASVMDRAVHIIWATGGSLLPEAEFAAQLAAGQGA